VVTFGIDHDIDFGEDLVAVILIKARSIRKVDLLQYGNFDNFVEDMLTADEIPNIVATMRRAWPVGDAPLAKIMQRLTPCPFGKRELLIKEGVAAGNAYFIETGMTRSYWVVDGEEITTSFSTEGTLVFSMDEVYYRRLSEEYVEAVEPIEAYAIGIDILLDAVSSDIGLCNWWRVIHQNEYRRIHRSHKERLTLPARERYEAFASQFPDVCRRARLTDIASYLGVTPATLSRIRSTKA